MTSSPSRIARTIVGILFALCLSTSLVRADAVMFEYPEQLEPLKLVKRGTNDWTPTIKSLSVPGGIIYPDQALDIELTIANAGKEAMSVKPVAELVRIGSRFDGYGGHEGDPMIGGNTISTIGLGEPIRISLPDTTVEAGKDATLKVDVPADVAKEFGCYAIILDLGAGKGRQPAGTFARAHPYNELGGDGKNSPLLYHLHYEHIPEQVALVARLGYKWIRTDGNPNWASAAQADPNAPFDWTNLDKWIQPFRDNKIWIQSNIYGSPRATITDENFKAYNYVHDEKYDPIWGNYVEECVKRYCGEDGAGPLQILDYWNEPWEGGGISAWKSDSVRYRALYKILYERAHKASSHILVGGASSIMNTGDKFFSQPDWQNTYKFDVLTDHYVQPYAAYGPRIAKGMGIFSIETETWLGYSEDMLVAAATHFIAAGQKKVNPNHPSQLIWTNGPAGPMPRPTAIAANFFLHFTGGREFDRIVFPDHLPWLYQWSDPEKKNVGFILAGDRHGLNEQSVGMYDQIRANGTITIDAMGGKIAAYDLFGNLYPVKDGKIELPLSQTSVYLEAAGSDPQIVIDAVSKGEIKGIKPVELFANDFVQPIDQSKKVEVEVHNVLNRPIEGEIVSAPPDLTDIPNVPVTLNAGETKRVALDYVLVPSEANAYNHQFKFFSDAVNVDLNETLHVNTLTRGTPNIDGDLADWAKATPVIVHGTALKRDAIESAWRPWEKEKDVPKGIAEIRLMWDDANIYVAVRERNKDWKPKPSLTKRNEDDYFGKDDLAHTYLKSPDETAPFAGNVLQIGFNLDLPSDLPAYDKAPTRMLAEDDTDYEYDVWGTPDNGAEIWRSIAPKFKLFHFYPRAMPAGYDGVPKNAKTVVKRVGDDTIYEIAIPLADMPQLKPEIGKSIAITFALPGSGVQFGAGRSKTRTNGMTLKPLWMGTPSNEIRWGFVGE